MHGFALRRPLLEKARDVRQAQLGVDHPQVAIVMANLDRLEAAAAALARTTAAATGAQPGTDPDAGPSPVKPAARRAPA